MHIFTGGQRYEHRNNALQLNGTSQYVDLDMNAAAISSLIGDNTGINPISGASEINYLTIFGEILIPSTVGLGDSILHFGSDAWTSPRWWLKTHPSTAKRMTVESKDNVSGFSWNAGADLFNYDELFKFAIVQRRRPSYAGGWIRVEFWINGSLIASADNYVGGRLYNGWNNAIIGAKDDNGSVSDYAPITYKDLRIYKVNFSSTEITHYQNEEYDQIDDTNLMAIYNFNNNVMNQVADQYHGTLVNDPSYVFVA